jgi:hypothetical protein
MAVLAEQGADLPIPPDGPVVRMVDQKIVRKQFYAATPAEGTADQQGRSRLQKFTRALDWAEQERLIGVEDINGTTFLWLSRPDSTEEEEQD